MAVKRQTNDAIRKSRHRMGYDDARAQGPGMDQDEILDAAMRAQGFVDRNYTAGKRLSAAYYEGKVAGFRQVLQERRGNAQS
jgi:hypothetical protein